MIAIYVAVRFEWQYGIGAAVATGHDVLVTAGLFSVFHLDFSLTSVAALLTLAGYSINDTVVVFDRIRENRRKYKRMNLGDLINLSTNQMVTRTILTSAATRDLAVAAATSSAARRCSISPPRSCSASWWARSRRPMSRRRCCCICPRRPAGRRPRRSTAGGYGHRARSYVAHVLHASRQTRSEAS